MIIKVEIYTTEEEIHLAYAHLEMNGLNINHAESGPLPKYHKYHPGYVIVGHKQVLQVMPGINNVLLDKDIVL